MKFYSVRAERELTATASVPVLGRCELLELWLLVVKLLALSGPPLPCDLLWAAWAESTWSKACMFDTYWKAGRACGGTP